jgi:hypothetical protein
MYDKVIVDQGWGNWGNSVIVPEGCYINGMRVRYEDPIDGDDTALNGIEIQYVSLPGSPHPVAKNVVVAHGHWGNWKPWAYAPDGYYIVGLNVRSEPWQPDNDDTGMNGIEMICKKFFPPPNDMPRVMVYSGNWGGWTEALGPYPDWGVVGLQARVEPPIDGDDTAMNGIRAFWRKLI